MTMFTWHVALGLALSPGVGVVGETGEEAWVHAALTRSLDEGKEHAGFLTGKLSTGRTKGGCGLGKTRRR